MYTKALMLPSPLTKINILVINLLPSEPFVETLRVHHRLDKHFLPVQAILFERPFQELRPYPSALDRGLDVEASEHYPHR